jgi:hypothetical protein
MGTADDVQRVLDAACDLFGRQGRPEGSTR